MIDANIIENNENLLYKIEAVVGPIKKLKSHILQGTASL